MGKGGNGPQNFSLNCPGHDLALVLSAVVCDKIDFQVRIHDRKFITYGRVVFPYDFLGWFDFVFGEK